MKQSAIPANSVRFGVTSLTSGPANSAARHSHQAPGAALSDLAILLEHRGENGRSRRTAAPPLASDTFVDFDHSLNTAVMRLLEAFERFLRKPALHRDASRRGYGLLPGRGEIRSRNRNGQTETGEVSASQSAIAKK